MLVELEMIGCSSEPTKLPVRLALVCCSCVSVVVGILDEGSTCDAVFFDEIAEVWSEHVAPALVVETLAGLEELTVLVDVLDKRTCDDARGGSLVDELSEVWCDDLLSATAVLVCLPVEGSTCFSSGSDAMVVEVLLSTTPTSSLPTKSLPEA